MVRQIDLKILPKNIDNQHFIASKIASKLNWNEKDISDWRILKRSIDARGYQPFFLLKIEASRGEVLQGEPTFLKNFKSVNDSEPILIVGAGPAGYFAALELIEQGLKPIIFERGKDVQTRRKDLRAIQQFGIVDPHSNYCFGKEVRVLTPMESYIRVLTREGTSLKF